MVGALDLHRGRAPRYTARRETIERSAESINLQKTVAVASASERPTGVAESYQRRLRSNLAPVPVNLPLRLYIATHIS